MKKRRKVALGEIVFLPSGLDAKIMRRLGLSLCNGKPLSQKKYPGFFKALKLAHLKEWSVPDLRPEKWAIKVLKEKANG